MHAARAHSHLAEVALLQGRQLVLVLVFLDLLKEYVPVLQEVAIDSSLISDLGLLQDLQEELEGDLHQIYLLNGDRGGDGRCESLLGVRLEVDFTLA